MVFKIGEGISCSSFSVKELDVIVHKKISLYNHIKFSPFCTPHQYQTWWLRWELGILTRPYCCSTSLANLNTMGKQITWIVWEMMIASKHDDIIKWNHFPCYWPLCREFTGHQWIPCTKASDAELWCFLWSAPELWINSWVNNREAGDLRHHHAHHDIIVIKIRQNRNYMCIFHGIYYISCIYIYIILKHFYRAQNDRYSFT